ncbi:peptide ligase PGM1-related protein [Streptomyces sp. SM12]|uniref:preATP grasp domain-containing protein n=1 Tax=Streptomyces sp. SM12 TaxID=1071602 RepID=UPI000CD4EF10|nr:peptide ligase PGM1-related protein [Streptomyces sp. SM12]
MITEHEGPGALVILANFVSPLAVDLGEESVLRQWAEQAPRKLWLTRPGDVLVSPVPLSLPFRRYVFHRLGIPEDAVTVVTVPDTPHLPMAQALAAHGMLRPLRALAGERPAARLLPTALDEASVALAADLRIPVVPYETNAPDPGTLRVVAEMNTKSGFRAVARALGLRVPDGRACTGAELGEVTGASLGAHGRVVVKPDRSAGGHGLVFVGPGDQPGQSPPPPDSRWVVEEHVDHRWAVSGQGHATATRVEVSYDGEMRVCAGSFAGYRSPLEAPPERARAELADWTRALGAHLAAEGYRGPYSLDLVCTRDGTLYALERIVRRTATNTVHAMVRRLTGPGPRTPRWSTGTVTAASPLSFDEAVRHLTEAGLDFQPGDAEGVLFFTDRPADGRRWRYAALAPSHSRLTEVEARLSAVLGHGPR